MTQVRVWLVLCATTLVLAVMCGCGGGTEKILYAVSPGSNNVSIFDVLSTGALTVTAEPAGTGTGPVAIGIDPLRRFAYVVDSALGIGPGGVSQYVLDASNGGLTVATLPAANGTTTPSVPVPTGANPMAIAIDSTGTFVFIPNHGTPGASCDATNTSTAPALNCTLSVFTIDPNGGALTEVKQQQPPCTPSQLAPCPLPTYSVGAPNAVATTGNMLFVAMTNTSAGTGSIATYTFTPSPTPGQALTLSTCPGGPGCLQGAPASTIAAGNNPIAMVMNSKGQFLFVIDQVANTVASFSVGSSGQLTAVGSPVATGTSPAGLCLDPGGKFLYTANQGSNNVSGFSVDSSGALAPLSGFPVNVSPGTSPAAITTDGKGSFLFVANSGTNNISVFSIDSSGALKAVANSPFPSVVPSPTGLASLN